jgi:hypothetical protein
MVTIQIVPYREIEGLTSIGRIRKLLTIAKDNKIVVLQGRLRKEEEMELIKVTMEEINKEFKGIELAVIDSKRKDDGGVRGFFTNMLLGDRLGMTVIGPSNVVKSIKKNPNKIELLTKNIRSKKKRRK